MIAYADGMTITGVESLTFTYRSHVGRDDEGHGHPAPEHDATQTLTRVRTSAGMDGYCFAGSEATATWRGAASSAWTRSIARRSGTNCCKASDWSGGRWTTAISARWIAPSGTSPVA